MVYESRQKREVKSIVQELLAKSSVKILIIGIAVLLPWGQTITFDLVWDDEHFIEKNTSLRDWRNIPEQFTELEAQVYEEHARKAKIFRPLRNVVYTVLWHVGGGEVRPYLYHGANIIFHGLVALLLCFTLRRIWYKTRPRPLKKEAVISAESNDVDNQSIWQIEAASLVAALGFAVHPVLSEAVCWAKSFDDLMAGFFVILAMDTIAGGRPSALRVLGTGLLFCLSLYSKVAALPFAAVGVWVWLRIGGTRNRCVFAGVFFLGIAGLYLLHRYFILGSTAQSEPIAGSYGETLMNMLGVLSTYIRLSLGIVPFNIDYSFMQAGDYFTWWLITGGAICLVGYVAVLAVFWWKCPDWKVDWIWAWPGLFLLPVSNVVPMMQYMAERFLYLPMLGVCTFVGWLFLRIGCRYRLVWGAAPVLLLMWGVIAHDRAGIWKNDVTLFLSETAKTEVASRLEGNAVNAVLCNPPTNQVLTGKGNKPVSSEMIANTRKILNSLLERFPENGQVINAIGVWEALYGEREEALNWFRTAIEKDPDKIQYLQNLRNALREEGREDRAEQIGERIEEVKNSEEDPPENTSFQVPTERSKAKRK